MCNGYFYLNLKYFSVLIIRYKFLVKIINIFNYSMLIYITKRPTGKVYQHIFTPDICLVYRSMKHGNSICTNIASYVSLSILGILIRLNEF